MSDHFVPGHPTTLLFTPMSTFRDSFRTDHPPVSSYVTPARDPRQRTRKGHFRTDMILKFSLVNTPICMTEDIVSYLSLVTESNRNLYYYFDLFQSFHLLLETQTHVTKYYTFLFSFRIKKIIRNFAFTFSFFRRLSLGRKERKTILLLVRSPSTSLCTD